MRQDLADKHVLVRCGKLDEYDDEDGDEKERLLGTLSARDVEQHCHTAVTVPRLAYNRQVDLATGTSAPPAPTHRSPARQRELTFFG